MSRDYELPLILNTPTFTICAATILDTGTEEQKRDRISAAIRGDEILVQLLSEPSGGSDLAGVITRADRRGDKWIINGAKTWSTSAFAADYGLLLARTNWDVPKHEGLTMFLVPINSPGITMRRIMQVDGGNEFCEEFFDDLELPDDAVVGEVNDGWAVASRQMFHERRAVGGGSEFSSGIGAEGATDQPVDYVALLEATGQTDNERIREQAGRALVRRAIQEQLIDHVYHGVLDGSLPPAAGSIIRITHAETVQFEIDTALAIAGAAGVVDDGTRTVLATATATRRGKPRPSAEAPPRSPATSSANGSSASPASTRPTAACRSIRSSASATSGFDSAFGRHRLLLRDLGTGAPAQPGLDTGQDVVVMRRRQPRQRIEQVRVGPDEDARLAPFDAAVNDFGRLGGLGHRDRGELLDHLFVAAALARRIVTEPRVAHDVGVDAAGVHVDGPDAGAAQLLAQRVGEPADRELGCTVSALRWACRPGRTRSRC